MSQQSIVRSLPFFTGLFLTCMCGLMLQIIETRILSVIAFYHLAFFAISTAMFGMTAGSLLVYFNARRFPADRLFENLSWIGVAFSLSTVLSALLMISTAVVSSPNAPLMSALVWLQLIIILIPPYVFAGMAISLALTRSPWPVGLVYGVDMVGAAAGCLIVLILLQHIDGVSALIAVAAIAATAAACFAVARPPGLPYGNTGSPARWAVFRHPVLVAVCLVAATVLNAASQPYGLRLSIAHNRLETNDTPAALRWNSFSRIKASQATIGDPAMWGASPKMPKTEVSQRWMNIDGDAGTAIYRFSDIKDVDFLKYDVTNIAYAIRNNGSSAVVGVGGGRDLLSAYMFGFRDVTGVELNPIFIDLLTDTFRDYNRLADLPGMHLVVDEARSWFAQTDKRFDLIQMSLIDTWAATGAGAFSLSENGLYTIEGWRHFLNALTPNGVFTVSRWYDPSNVAEIGRLVSLAVASLHDRGISDPGAHIFIAGTPILATLIVSRSPLTADDLARLDARAEELGFNVLLSPGRGSPVLQQIAHTLTAKDLGELSRLNHIDLMAPTDDRPFFFNQLILTDPMSLRYAYEAASGNRKGSLLATATVAVIVALSTVLVLFTMILPALQSVRQTPVWLARSGTTYFALLGFGFMFIEIGLIQRTSVFLGDPVYGLAIGLFSIIIAAGIGALVSERVKLDTTGKILTWAIVLGAYVLIMPTWVPHLMQEFEGSDLLVRATVSVATIVPPGILMGFGFPSGMRMVSRIDTRPTPWFWAVNGAAGVLAASTAVLTSIAFSINVSLFVGAACYFLLGPVSLALKKAHPLEASEVLLGATPEV
jgi:hypothetical protein